MKSLGIMAMMVLVAGIISSPLLANAQTYQQTIPTDKGTLKIGINLDPASPKPNEPAKLKIDFVNKDGAIQKHVDYTVTVTKDGSVLFKTMPAPTHTGEGQVALPVQFKEGKNDVLVQVQGITFVPVNPEEKATFSITVGNDGAKIVIPKEETKTSEQKQSDKSTPPPTDEKKQDSKMSGTVKITKEKSDKKDTKKKDIKKTVKKPVVKKTQ